MVRQMFEHMEWADANVWSVVLRTRGAGEDSKLPKILQHLHATQRAFLDVWTGKPVRLADLMEPRTLSSMCDWARQYHEECRAFVAGLDSAAMEGEMKLPWAERMGLPRPPARTSLNETMIQVPAHSTYHRGQVNLRLRDIGGEPPLVDFIAWVWMGKPAPEWLSSPEI